MQIKVRVQNGETVACLYNPATSEVVEERTLSEGEECCFTATDVHDALGIEVGETTSIGSEETETAPDANPDTPESPVSEVGDGEALPPAPVDTDDECDDDEDDE